MDITTIEGAFLFFLLFVPGFISILIFDLLIPNYHRDFSKSIYQIIGFSFLNYTFFSWLIYINYHFSFYSENIILFVLSIFITLFLFPILWPIIFINSRRIKFIRKYIRDPIPKPWDVVFSRNEPLWVIIHFIDGSHIGGLYDRNSSASSFPASEQIYLEKIYYLDDFGRFTDAVKDSRGMLVSSENIKAVEFFSGIRVDANGRKKRKRKKS